ncbi:Glycosyltransferase family 9 (heptosyltransferase) [compost metagenome]
MTNSPRGILVDHHGEKGIGDIVCELSTYEALRALYPESILISRGSRTLAWGNPFIDAFDEASPDETFDRIVRFQPNSHQLQDSLAKGLTIFEHFLQTHGMPAAPYPPRLYSLPHEIADLGLTPDRPDDLIIAYSVDSKEPDRRWGEERFVELLQGLQLTYGGTYVEIGSGFTAGHLGIGYDLVGQTDLRQTMAVLSSADLFIGNHGGLTHLAGGVGTPILCPWGASTPYRAYAYDETSRGVETAPECRHCGWTGQVLPQCRATDVFQGRTPCTQAISVAQLRQAADQLLPFLHAQHTQLRQEREERRRCARDPQQLARYEQAQKLNPYANLRLFMGGRPGWGREAFIDSQRPLRQIVAFPDWHNPASAWEGLVATYVSEFDADDPYVLVLSAAPLTGPDVSQLLTDYIGLLGRHANFPKILLLLGNLSDADRRHLITQAEAYVPLEGPYHLKGVEPARYVTRFEAIAELVRS